MQNNPRIYIVPKALAIEIQKGMMALRFRWAFRPTKGVYYIAARCMKETAAPVEIKSEVLYGHLLSCIRRCEACYKHCTPIRSDYDEI